MFTNDHEGQAQENIEKKQSFPYTIANYITNIVLPKCVLAHGGIIASVYFQIAFNINNQERAKSWQQQKCWKDPNKMASDIGCNSRKAKHAIKQLIQVGLIEESFHGKLKMYKLIGDKIYQFGELSKFLIEVEKKIVSSVETNKMKDLRDQITDFNKIIRIEDEDVLIDLLKRTTASDILVIKQLFVDAEQIYKGSSLFFMKLLEIKIKNNKKNIRLLNILDQISGNQQAIMLGCSLATLNRYIYDYQNSGLLEKVDLIFGQTQVGEVVVEKENVAIMQEGVMNKMSEFDFYCPICKQTFENGRSIGMHLGKMKDEDHINFNQLRRDKRCPYNGFKALFEENIHMFNVTIEEVVKEQPKKQITDEYMKIPCDCKTSCKECHLDWFDDFFKSCNHIRKSAYMSEYGLNNVKEEKKRTVVASKQTKEIKEVGFEEIPEVKKQVAHGTDTAPGLLKFFYDFTGTKSPNWGKECGQIKTQLNKGLTPDEARIVLKHMHRKGQVDIRFFSGSINDALLEEKYLIEMEQEGTTPYLVKYFYNGHGLSVNIQTLTKDVQKIQETINSGLNYEQTKAVLDYMISIKCTVLNFIAAKRTEALAKQTNKIDGVANSGSRFKSNPSFFDQNELVIIRDELAGLRTKISKIKEEFREQAHELAKQLYRDHKFSSRFTMFEWAWRVGLELDIELYQLGLKELNKETYIDFALRNDQLDKETLDKWGKMKVAFEKWLSKQHETFNKNNITTVK